MSVNVLQLTMLNPKRFWLNIIVVFLWLKPSFGAAFLELHHPRFDTEFKRNGPFKHDEKNVGRDYRMSRGDTNLTDNSDNTALHFAIISGHEMFANMLIQNGADVNVADKYGNTALHLAAMKGYANIADLLIRNGASTNASNDFGDTPLHFAANRGYEKIASSLLQDGVNVDISNQFGDTPLHFASNNGHEKIVELLIQSGANVNIANNDSNTALHFAVMKNKDKIINLLLENNARYNIKNNEGKTAKDLALENGQSNIIDMFKMLSSAQKACKKYTTTDVGDRILGGETTESGEFPWMVALGYLGDNNQMSFDCGGTIISEYFILTAAHCATTRRYPVLVRFGNISDESSSTDIDLTTDEDHQPIIRHPNFSNALKTNDIALIRLSKPIEFSDIIRPACLQTDLRDEASSVNLTVTGWGFISVERPQRSNILLAANLTTMPLSDCNRTLLEYNQIPNTPSFRNGISESQYCAFDPYGVKDSCQGDSGGPLQIVQYGSDKHTAKIVGIVSFGVGCGTVWPGIYTRVAYYLDWIESYVWPNGV